MLGSELLEVFFQFMMPGIQDASLEDESRAGNDEVCQREAARDDGHDGCHKR